LYKLQSNDLGDNGREISRLTPEKNTSKAGNSYRGSGGSQYIFWLVIFWIGGEAVRVTGSREAKQTIKHAEWKHID
jgi:hypothetical protein